MLKTNSNVFIWNPLNNIKCLPCEYTQAYYLCYQKFVMKIDIETFRMNLEGKNILACMSRDHVAPWYQRDTSLNFMGHHRVSHENAYCHMS